MALSGLVGVGELSSRAQHEQGQRERASTECARNCMLFGVAESKENTGTSKRKAWKCQAYTTEDLKCNVKLSKAFN